MLQKILSKNAVTNIIMSVIFVILAILMIARPEGMQSAVTIILGIISIIGGIFKIIGNGSNENKYNTQLSTGIILIIAGCILMFFGEKLVDLFRLAIGGWIIYSSIMDIIEVFKMKEQKTSTWYVSLGLCVLMFITGLVVLFTQTVLIKTIGIFILIFSILDIIENLILIAKVEQTK